MAALSTQLASLSLSPVVFTSTSSASLSATKKAPWTVLLPIECAKHPQKKATAHHNKTRPKKHNPYDKNRKGPTFYPRLPKAPPIWSFDTSSMTVEVNAEVEEVAVA